jgi:S1-C subfamily serine protease
MVRIVATRDILRYQDDPEGTFGAGSTHQETARIGGGSGIIVRKDGYIITNKHVVHDPQARYRITTHEGATYVVGHVWEHPSLDLAVLQIVDEKGKNLTGLHEAQSITFGERVSVGSVVFGIGYGEGDLPESITMGVISATGVTLPRGGTGAYTNMYQTTLHIVPGSSG